MTNNNNKNTCICPVCNHGYKDLMAHIKSHKEYKITTKEDFKKIFPNYNGPLRIDVRKKCINTCKICGKTYDYNNSLMLHYKNIHPEYYENIKKIDNKKCANIICPICNNNYSDIKQHVYMKHKLDWEDFCKQYDWDIKYTKCITNEYRKKLSTNKKYFYKNTKRGKELREQQSIKWSNENPATNRKCIEKSIYTRSLNGNIPVKNYRGILVMYDNHRFRSFNEFTFYILCKEFNISLKYEPKGFLVKWFNSEKQFLTTYLPDYYVDDFGLIELKESRHTVNLAKQEEKYLKTKKIYDAKHIKFDIYAINDILKLLHIDIKNYQKKEIIQKYIDAAIKDDSILIYCKANSATIANYFGKDFIHHKNIKIK